jgi:phosphate transport system substrate-binding protein
MKNVLATLIVIGACSLVAQEDGATQVDPKLPEFSPAKHQFDGGVNALGADTLYNLMTFWAELYHQAHPAAPKIQLEGEGTRSASTGLIGGAANLAPMTGDWRPEELEAFKEIHGYPPTTVKVAIDMIAVFVHKDNPVARRGLTLVELDAIFSSERKAGHSTPIDMWDDLGIGGEWARKPIVIYGRNLASGTASLFRQNVLKNAEFNARIIEQPGSSALVKKVSEDRFSIGYTGVGRLSSNVAIVPIAEKAGGPFITPKGGNIKTYPVGRYLTISLNRRPGQPLPPALHEFFRIVYSREGQQVVVDNSFIPLDFESAAAEAAKLGIVLERRSE